MVTAYSPILKLALPVQGELTGTWGDVVNDNITSMVEQAIAGRAVINTWTVDSHTLTTANGTTSESRCAMLELTDTGVALTGAGTVICPTASKIYVVKNASGQNITVKTSGGTGVLVPNGRTTFLFCDGTNVLSAMTHTTSLELGTTTVVTAVLDEDNMASDSATALATQQSIKAYVDSKVGEFDTLAEVLAIGNTTGGTDLAVSAGDDITFTDSSKAIFGAGSDLQIYHDGSNSYIDDAGTGNLLIRGSAITRIQSYIGEDMVVAVTNGAVNLYHDAGLKLATTATGVDITGTVTADGLILGDNDKAIFGAGSDLEIYHDGSGSYISDQGTGPLNLLSGGVRLKDTTDTTTMLAANAGGAVTLYHNDLPKLATTSTGVDVTGTVTADGLTVDGVNDIVFSSGGNSVRSDGTLQIQADADGSGAGVLRLRTNATTRQQIDNNGDISFYEDTGTTPKFFWDAGAESLGIGTTNPSATLDVVGDAEINGNLTVASNSPTFNMMETDAAAAYQQTQFGLEAGNFLIQTRNSAGTFVSNDYLITKGAAGAISQQWRIDNSAKLFLNANGLGIGTSSPASIVGGTDTSPVLSIGGSDSILTNGDKAGSVSFITNDGSYASTYPDGVTGEIASITETSLGGAYGLAFYTGTTGGSGRGERMRIDNSGNVGIGTSSPSSTLEISATTTPILNFERQDSVYGNGIIRSVGNTGTVNAEITLGGGSNNFITFDTNGEEAMRIDGNGSVGIGTLSPTSGRKLHVLDDGDTNVKIETITAAGDARLELTSDSAGVSQIRFGDEASSNTGLLTYAHATDSMAFTVNASESLRIDSSGHAIIPAGVTLGTAAGVYSADKTLDDYEEGTWIPVISDGTNNATSNIAVGSYTKTGNHVHVQGRVRLSSLGSATGALEITGLPFTSQSLANNFCAMTIGRAIGLNLVAGTAMVGDLRSTVTTVKLLVWDASLGNTAVQDTEFSDDGDISFSMDYLSN